MFNLFEFTRFFFFECWCIDVFYYVFLPLYFNFLFFFISVYFPILSSLSVSPFPYFPLSLLNSLVLPSSFFFLYSIFLSSILPSFMLSFFFSFFIFLSFYLSFPLSSLALRTFINLPVHVTLFPYPKIYHFSF